MWRGMLQHHGELVEPWLVRARVGGRGLMLLGSTRPAHQGWGPEPGDALADDGVGLARAVGAGGAGLSHLQEADDQAEQDTGKHDIDQAHGVLPSSNSPSLSLIRPWCAVPAGTRA